jgi:hypothetical protein
MELLLRCILFRAAKVWYSFEEAQWTGWDKMLTSLNSTDAV